MQGSRRGVERQGPRSHLEQRLLSSGMAAFVERDNEEEGCSEEEDPRSSATRRLSESLAAAVVMRLSLPGDVAAQLAALPATPSALSLALARDDGSGLVHLPVMEQGSLVWSPDVPGEALPQRSAAWQSFRSGRCLLWRRRLDSPATKYADWAGLLHVHSSAQALLTMPLAVPGYPGALGAATFALGAEPAAADVDALRLLLAGLACAISHHTKLLWEESLGFLNLVIPRRVIQRMLSSSLSLGPLAAAAAAPAGAAAVANGAPAVALEAASEAVAENPGMLCTPACAGADAARRSLNSPGPFGRAAAGTCMRIKTASESDPSKCLQPEACGAEVAPAAAPLLQPASPTASTGMHNGVTTLRQKWNLEFADPVLEEHFKTWFNTLQTKTDLAVMRSLASGIALGVPLVAALAVHNHLSCHLSWGVVLAVTHDRDFGPGLWHAADSCLEDA